MRVLCVEDNPDTQTLLRYLLQPRFDLTLVPHVHDAVSALHANTFDLLIFDINLGEQQTGIELLQQVRCMEAHRDTPALALTAYAMPGDRERFLDAGFNGYVSKPFTRQELFAAIDTVLKVT